MSKKKKHAAPKPPKKKRHWTIRFILSSFTLSLRTVLFTIMFIFCLIAAAWVLAMNLVNAQQISEELTKRLEQTFNRPVVITSLDLKFFNMVELKGFSVLDTEVGFAEPFLSAESVTIRYKLLALLEKKLIIDEVTLNKPRINILRAQDGSYNVPEIKLPQAGQTSFVAAGTSGEKLEISIEDWTIRDGVLSYKDLATGVSHALYELNLHFEKLRFNELSRFTLDTVLRNRWKDNISDLEIKGTGHVNFANFKWGEFALRSFKPQVALFRKPVSLTIDLDNLYTPFFNIRAAVPAFEKKDLSLYSGNAKLPDFKLPASTVTARGVMDNAYQRIRLNEGVVSFADVKTTLSGTVDLAVKPFDASLSIKTNEFNVKGKQQYLLLLKPFDLSGALSADAKLTREKGAYALTELNAKAKNLNVLWHGFVGKGLDGEFTAKKDFTDLYVKTTGGEVVVNHSTFDKLNLTGTYRRGNVYAHISGAQLNKVPIKMSLSIANIKRASRKIQTTIYWKHLNPMDLIDTVKDFTDVIQDIPKKNSKQKAKKPAPWMTGELAWLRNFRDRLPSFMSNFSGNISADTFSTSVISGSHFNAEFSFNGFLPGAKKLNGSLDARLQDGIVHQMEQLAEEQQALNITFTPFLIMHRMERSGAFRVGDVLKDVPFTDLAISADFRNGLMGINNAYIQGPTISASISSGWVDWVQETLNLTIYTMFAKTSRSGALAENLTDESGNPALAFKVSGPMLKPKVEMLRAKKAGSQIEQARLRGIRTEFETSQDFIKGDFNAKK